MSVLLIALAAAALVGGEPSSTDPADEAPRINAACSAQFDPLWPRLMEVYGEGRMEDLLSLAVLPQPCANEPHVQALVGVVRGEADIRLGKPAEAIAELGLIEVAQDAPYWVHSRLILLAAYGATGDQVRFLAERDRLVAANEAALTTGLQPYARKVERFETGYAFVDAYERIVDNGEPRHTMFVASPKGSEMPMMFEVNQGEMLGLAALFGEGQEAPPFGDLNSCAMHATLMVPPEESASYAGLRKRALAVFAERDGAAGDALSSSGATSPQEGMCSGIYAVLPGLRPAEVP